MRIGIVLSSAVRTAILIASFPIALFTTSERVFGACTLAPERSTNTVGQSRTVMATITTNGSPAPGVFVSFIIISGPDTGASGASSTDTNGQTSFIYAGSAGTNVLQASGSAGGSPFTCMATQVWRVVAAPPTITCPGPIVTNAASETCSRTVSFQAPASGGGGIPVVRCRAGGDTVPQSGHPFPVGTTTVTCVASNANGTNSCSFTVTVNETEAPSIACPGDIVAPVAPGESSAVVEFQPTAEDNCSTATAVCDPPSGSTFALGATTVTCTANDSSGNTNNCSFTVFVEEVQPETHDIAVTKIKAPKFVNLNARAPVQTKRVVVTIQNRSPHTETINDFDQLAALVTLTVESLDPNACVDIVPEPLGGPPQRRLPVNLKPKQKLNVYFNVTFDCAVNPAKGLGQEDFRYIASVHHEAIDPNGAFDTHPECDVCPREPLEGGVDPNPNGRIRDKGCGAPRGDGTFGNEVLTDVSIR